MQRRLISFAPRTFCAGRQSLHTLIRRQPLVTVCRSSPGSSRCAHHPPPVYVFHFSKGLCSFSPVSPKNNLLHHTFPWLSQRRCCSNEPDMAEQRFIVEYAKRGTAGCKKCKDKIPKEVVRIGKVVPNPFSESAGEMKEWYHVKCIFEKLERARATTKKIEDITDLDGWEELEDEDKEIINKHVSGKMRNKYVFAILNSFSVLCSCFKVCV